MAINLNGADHSQFNRDEKNKNVPRSVFSGTYTTAFTLNEGQIVPCYRELLVPNSNLEKSETYVMYQSPLATRNFSNQRVYTHSFSMAIKHMWHEWREVQFGGRYQDNPTPILHFRSVGSYSLRDNPNLCFLNAAFYDNWIARGSLGDYIGGMQVDIALGPDVTPNPWVFFLYLTVYKYYFMNQALLRGDPKWRRIWFPRNEEKWSFETGDFNEKTGIVSRFWSPEHRSGCHIEASGTRYDSNSGTLSFSNGLALRDNATGMYCDSSGVFSSSSPVYHHVSVDLPYPEYYRNHEYSDWIRLNHAHATKVVLEYFSNLDNPVCLLDLFEVRYRNFRNDYYLSGLPSPLMVPSGDDEGATGKAGKPSISVDNFDFTVDASDVVGDRNVDGTGGPWFDVKSFGGADTGSESVISTGPRSSNNGNANLVRALDRLKVNSQVSLSIDMDALRLLSATTMYLEALTRSDGDYASNVRAIYGVTPLELDLKPRYLGGTASNVYSMDVVQTAPQSGDSTMLGSVTQRGQAGNRGGHFKHFTKDSEVVLTVVSVVPDSVYCQGMDRKFLARSPLDIPNPMFNGLGMDAILNYELYVGTDNDVNLSPFAYNGAWDFYRFRRNEVHDLMIPVFDSDGNLLNRPFTQMNQVRYFSETPTLSTEFVSTKGNIPHEHLAVTDVDITPEYSVIVSNSANVVYPLVKFAKGQGL